jgi:hypothetical protein
MAMAVQNRAVVLANRPAASGGAAAAVNAQTLKIVDLALPELGPGEVLLRNRYLSLDPYMASYSLSVHEAERAIEARVVSEVAASNNDALKEGDLLWGFFGWELYTVLPAGLTDRKGYDVRDNVIDLAKWPRGAPLSYAVSIMGMPGLTAHVGIVDIGKAQAGETVYISSAAGALGQVAGQVAKLRGCRVVGSAGSDDKVDFVLSLGYDAAFNYRTVPGGIEAELARLCPDGIDVYFDNVGGETLDAALACANKFARFALCGMISTYGVDNPHLIANLFHSIRNSVTLTGYTIYDHFPAKMAAYQAEMGAWLSAGKVRYEEVIVEGLDNLPGAFIDMMAGRHGLGKCLIALPPKG